METITTAGYIWIYGQNPSYENESITGISNAYYVSIYYQI